MDDQTEKPNEPAGDQDNKLSSIIDFALNTTSYKDFLDDMVKARDEALALLNELDFTDNLDAVESILRRREVEFYGQIEEECSRLRTELRRLGAIQTEEVQKAMQSYRSAALALEKTIHEIERKFSKYMDQQRNREPEDPIEARKRIESMANLLGKTRGDYYRGKISNLISSISSLKKAVSSYRRRKQLRVLKRYGGWIFWSLVVFTIGFGAIGELISGL